MNLQRAEKLKHEYTDQYVVVDVDRPELARFKGKVGRVKTVNMSGRALVQFDPEVDISWYDIELDFLKVVDKPPPKAEKPKGPKAAAAKKAAAKKTDPAADKSEPTDKPAGAKPPKAPEAAKPAEKPAEGEPELSPLEIARMEKQAAETGPSPSTGGDPSAEPADAEKPSPDSQKTA
jgi:hypothetical protein